MTCLASWSEPRREGDRPPPVGAVTAKSVSLSAEKEGSRERLEPRRRGGLTFPPARYVMGLRRLRVEALPPMDGELPVLSDPNVVLFVEDDALLHLGIDEAFRAAGLGLIGLLCWREADHLLASRPEGLCALVTDVELGEGLTGWALARRARLVLPSLAIVYASGCGGHDFGAEAVADARFVSKPYAPDYLAQVTRGLLGRG